MGVMAMTRVVVLVVVVVHDDHHVENHTSYSYSQRLPVASVKQQELGLWLNALNGCACTVPSAQTPRHAGRATTCTRTHAHARTHTRPPHAHTTCAPARR